jgi:hypothetical protein
MMEAKKEAAWHMSCRPSKTELLSGVLQSTPDSFYTQLWVFTEITKVEPGEICIHCQQYSGGGWSSQLCQFV